VLTVQGAMPRETDFSFSLHATVRCGADARQALEQLCRYITRPALANERVQTHASGQAVLKLKTPWRDGTTHLVMSPLEFMLLPIEGQVCGNQTHWVYVCRGSGAGIRLQPPTGRCTSHTGTSRSNGRYVQVSGRPPRSSGRRLTAICGCSAGPVSGKWISFMPIASRSAASIHS
jgi:hypothetical protein